MKRKGRGRRRGSKGRRAKTIEKKKRRKKKKRRITNSAKEKNGRKIHLLVVRHSSLGAFRNYAA